DRVLEGEEDAFAGPSLGRHREQVLPLVSDVPCRDLVAGTAGENVGEGALSGAVRAHDGVDLARAHRQIHAAEDLVAGDARVKVLDFEQRHRLSPPILRATRRAAFALRPRTPSGAP